MLFVKGAKALDRVAADLNLFGEIIEKTRELFASDLGADFLNDVFRPDD